MNQKPAFGCVNNTIRLLSGKYLDLANPKPDQFELIDIANALSKICRFGGQIKTFYSVAEHSMHCRLQAAYDGLMAREQLACLFHDAAEAFIGDMVKPLKIMIPKYAEVEASIEAAIGEKFGIDFALTRDVVREIDNAMLIAERNFLFSADKVEWTGEKQVRKLHPRPNFLCLEPAEASRQFIESATGLFWARNNP